MFLLLGSAFYQSLTNELGWYYTMLIVGEGLLLIWIASARKQLRFLYAGIVSIVVAVVGQLVRQVFSINAAIALGILGLLIMITFIFVERNLEMVKRMTKGLEEWE